MREDVLKIALGDLCDARGEGGGGGGAGIDRSSILRPIMQKWESCNMMNMLRWVCVGFVVGGGGDDFFVVAAVGI